MKRLRVLVGLVAAVLVVAATPAAATMPHVQAPATMPHVQVTVPHAGLGVGPWSCGHITVGRNSDGSRWGAGQVCKRFDPNRPGLYGFRVAVVDLDQDGRCVEAYRTTDDGVGVVRFNPRIVSCTLNGWKTMEAFPTPYRARIYLYKGSDGGSRVQLDLP